jgi:hypothetical protein
MSFDDWLYAQLERRDDVGRLARYVFKDAGVLEQHLATPYELARYLENTGAHTNMVDRADLARTEFESIPADSRNPVDADGNLVCAPWGTTCLNCRQKRYARSDRCPCCGLREVDVVNRRWQIAVATGFIVLYLLFIVASCDR